jgi:hypothetical protein
MPDSTVSEPTFSTFTTSGLSRLMVPPITRLAGCLATGWDSPVSRDSSTLERPSTTEPSAGKLSPGPTRTWSPGVSLTAATVSSWRLSG